MKRSLLLLGALAVVVGAFQFRTADAVAPASEHPEAWGWTRGAWMLTPEYRYEEGPEWVAASRVLTADGSLRHVRMHKATRDGLEWQFERSSLAPGFADGEYASAKYADRKKWCAGTKRSQPSFIMPEGSRFITSLLWADVAVTATLGEPVAGFYVGGNPGLLFPLSDVEPLVRGTSYPRYALVPVDQVAIRGRVFCADNPHHQTQVYFVAGDRAVIVGERSEHDIVQTGRWWKDGVTPQVALVQEDGALRGLPWRSPTTLEELLRRVDEAESGGLLLAASNLAHEEWASRNRVTFVDKLERYEADGCRVAEVVLGAGALDWEATRMACPENPVPRPASALYPLDVITFEE
ncbi:MAG: hypothetical protein OXF79_22905 [Chloroflexi bacterium]|nr:hypothetical protein [Chloroflexota bacterium]